MKAATHAWLLVGLLAMATPDQAASQPIRLGSSLKSIQIHRVPPPPGGGDWDGGILRNLFLGNVTGIYPDIEICVGLGGRVACGNACINAQLHPDPGYEPTVCQVTLEGRVIIGSRLVYPNPPPEPSPPLDRRYVDLVVTVNEFDATLNAQPKRPMGRFSLHPNGVPLLPEPETCTETSPCRVAAEQFMVSFVTEDAGVLGRPGTGSSSQPSESEPSSPDTPQSSEELSYFDRFKKWLDEFIWDKVKEEAGWRGTALEGLAQQAEIAKDKYAQRLLDTVKKLELESRFEAACKGKSGTELTSCAYQVVAEKDPSAAQAAQTGELTVGFLANMWKSVCAFVGMVCK